MSFEFANVLYFCKVYGVQISSSHEGHELTEDTGPVNNLGPSGPIVL